MSELASVTFDELGPVVVVRVTGEIDLSNADEVQRTILDRVANSADGLVVDLSAMSYLDSSGIRMLGDLARRLRWREQRLVVVAPVASRV